MKRDDSKQRRPDPSQGHERLRRTPADLRLLAGALARHPIPELTKMEIAQRWRVGKDTVRKLLRAQNLDPGPEKGRTIPLIDLLRIEGEPDPLAAWALGSEEARAILQADLLTLEEHRDADLRRSKLHPGTYRRHAREGRPGAIRIGKVYRFRPPIQRAARWLESERGDAR